MSNRMMYGTNKLKMVKPMEGSMTLLQVCCLVLSTFSCFFNRLTDLIGDFYSLSYRIDLSLRF